MRHLRTLLTQKPSRILSYIHQLSDEFNGKDYTFMFALSANFDHPHELEQVVSAMRNLRCDRGKGKARMVGCLSGPVSNMELPGGDRAALSCAVAVFDSPQCVPFYSGLQGRKETQVGRWHSFRREVPDDSERLDVLDAGGGKDINWEDIWNNRSLASINKNMVPEALLSISPSKIDTLSYMTIPHPDLFTSALSDFLSSSTSACTSLGLVAAPTHFVTGRDVTLFFDDKIYGNGTVGLAILKSEDEGLHSVTTEFIGMRKLGEQMNVTGVEGNMLISLDDSNPTQLLLRAIERAEISSNRSAPTSREAEQFALAALSPAATIRRTWKITAGDPTSRGGSISLDGTDAPTQGEIVQFFSRLPNTSLTIPPTLVSSTKPSIAYLTVPEAIDDQPSGKISETQHLILQDTFLATSTSGFLLSQFSGEAHLSKIQKDRWSCTFPGGIAVLTYH